MKKKFIDFLKKHNAYEVYVQNAVNDHHAVLDGIVKRHDPENWVRAAFDWSLTQQGQDYWLNIHKMWINEVKG